MDIQYAILGLLSWKPFAGYDLKRYFAESAFYYWSGNNNQIYKALLNLHKQGLVSVDVQLQESLPARKVYSITAKGLEALKRWLQTTPELPELRKPFLVQLAWSDLLEHDELDALLGKYEDEVRMQLITQEEQARRGGQAPGRTPRESILWQAISENILSSYENELKWIRELRKNLMTPGKNGRKK